MENMDRKTFLEKYLTVVGSPEAIENEDEEFIKKYLTVVGCPPKEEQNKSSLNETSVNTTSETLDETPEKTPVETTENDPE